MDMLVALLALSTLPGLVAHEGDASISATVEIGGTEYHILRKFSGESFQLRCHVFDKGRGIDWEYHWYKGMEQLPHTGQDLNLRNVKVGDGGNYFCQGKTKPDVGQIYSMMSPPAEIFVDGGWAILHVPAKICLVGETVTLTCRIRNKYPIHEFILFKDGIEINRENEPHFHLPNVTIDDQGTYSCQASWDLRAHTHSVASVATYLKILEVLSQPVLDINDSATANERILLTCHVEYNAHAPAPHIHFYFYRDNQRLGPAKTQSAHFFNGVSGAYSCRANVPELGLSKTSKPQQFKKKI